MWSEARLLLAAVALLMGGVPAIFLVMPGSPLTLSLLHLAWLITGAATIYLAYRWHMAEHTLFGKKDSMDTFAYVVLLVSGINLGWVGVSGHNIGMSIWSGRFIFVVVGILYLWTAYYLWNRWNKAGKRLF
jgi:hypothetical protein